MTASLHTLPTQAPYVAAAKDRIEAVRKVARDLWDVRDEETNQRRQLRAFEALFLSAHRSIQQKRAKERHDACKLWGAGSCAYDAVCNMSYRGEADEMDAALASYNAERDRFYNADIEAVADAIDAAE